jgi:hypothetical protein
MHVDAIPTGWNLPGERQRALRAKRAKKLRRGGGSGWVNLRAVSRLHISPPVA